VLCLLLSTAFAFKNCGWALRFALLCTYVSTYIQPEILCAQLLLHSLMDFVHTHTQWPTLHGDDRKDGILWCRKFYMSYWGHPCPTDTFLVLLNWCILYKNITDWLKKRSFRMVIYILQIEIKKPVTALIN